MTIDTLPRFADAIVVGAGSSSRMAGTDKLAHEIGGRPLLAWALDGVAGVPAIERIVLVTNGPRVARAREEGWLPERVVAVVEGGPRRHESVAAGLAALEGLDHGDASAGDRVVLVHDAARPLASAALFMAIFAAATEHGAAIPVLAISETIKRLEAGRVAETVDRSGLATAQTPQGVRRGLLRDAFNRFPPAGPETWTDEAALLEACRIAVHAIPGEPSNIKVTVPGDLDRVGTALLRGPDLDGRTRHAAIGPRIGVGSDSHPFGPGRPLALGGVELADAFRLHGHSDGDVALHAVADALLGAAALGDLGRLFPADVSTPPGISSGELLREVVRRLAAAGYRPTSIDLTIVGARPKLADHLVRMRAAIAALLDVPHERVSVKASSGNLDGMEGAGRGISANAVATIEPAR